jgi:osmoprotectant transport system ATP-binding protein
MIQLEGVCKNYGDTPAVRDISFTVEEGELLILLGTSGCGKTTTLKMINRLVDCSAGSIFVDNRDISGTDPVQLRRSIGYVFQAVGLFPHMTVEQNIAIIPKLEGWDSAEQTRRTRELLELLNLSYEEFGHRKPADLSGGQRQRVGVARALAIQPKIMLMDEPFGALDPITRMTLQEEYQKIREQVGVTTIFVTHDMTEALLMGDRIAAMDNGEIIQIGTPRELMNNPVNEYVEQLMQAPKHQMRELEKISE